MIQKKFDNAYKWGISVFTCLMIYALWYFFTKAELVSQTIIPSPDSVWHAFVGIVKNGYKNHSLMEHVGVSLGRLLAAFCMAMIIGAPLGLLSGFCLHVRAVVEPIIDFLKPLPPLAYYTLLVLWLGIGNSSKIVLLMMSCLPPIYIACMTAVIRIPQVYLDGAYSVGANKIQVFLYVVTWFCFPQIITGMRTSLGVGYTTLISAEMVAATSGIGWVVLDASRFMRSDIIFCGIFVMALTGIVMDVCLRLLEQLMVPWANKRG